MKGIILFCFLATLVVDPIYGQEPPLIDREQIAWEELVREIVKAEIQSVARPETGWRQSLWSVLNSAFGVAFMTTGVVGIASFLWRRYD